MKKREGVTKVTPVRDTKRIGVPSRRVRINWEGKISFGDLLVDEIGMKDQWSMTIEEDKEENILYLDFSYNNEDLPYDPDKDYSSIRREEKLDGRLVINCKEGLRGVSIEKIRHLVNQTKGNKTITSVVDDDPSVSLDDEIVVGVKIT